MSRLRRSIVLPTLLLPCAATGQTLDELVSTKSPNCAVTAPPASAGIAVTPGGFVMVHPRNAALRKDYTGCKILWVVDGERYLRLATLAFEKGVLRRAVAHDVRSPSGVPEAACSFPEGRSLMPKAGRRIPDAGCANFPKDEFYALHLPTWPRACLATPESAECSKEPD